MSPDNNPDRLTSWKTIAAYLQCNERTVKRWEQDRALPVRRLPGPKRGGVFAYRSELDAWLRAEGLRAEKAPVDEQPSGTGSEGASPTPAPPSRRRLIGGVVAAAAALLIVTVAVLLIGNKKLTRFPHRPAPGAEALYIRGRYLWNLRTADSLAKAAEAFTQAIEKDPSYAEAYAGLAEIYDLLPQFGQADIDESLARAITIADRAIQINPNLADAHRARAFAVFFRNWDIPGSDAEFRRALELDPNSAQTHQWYASSLERRSEGAECLRQIDEALRLNPTSAAIATDAALFHADFGDLEAGLKALKEMERTQPALLTPSQFLRELDFVRSDYPTYIEDLRHYASITKAPDDIALAEAAAAGWARGGKTGLLEAKARALKRAFDRGTEQGYKLGQTLLLMGHPEEALPYFRAAVEKRCIELITMEECPWAKPLSRDPGYAALFAEIHARMRGGRSGAPSLLAISFRLPQ